MVLKVSEIRKAIRARLRITTVRRVGDWLVRVPDYDRWFYAMRVFMEFMGRMEWENRVHGVEVTNEERADIEDTVLDLIGAIDDAVQARKPLKRSDGILWAPDTVVRRKANNLFQEFMTFTDKPAGVYLMDTINGWRRN